MMICVKDLRVKGCKGKRKGVPEKNPTEPIKKKSHIKIKELL